MFELPKENEEGLAPTTAIIAALVLLVITGFMGYRMLTPVIASDKQDEVTIASPTLSPTATPRGK